MEEKREKRKKAISTEKLHTKGGKKRRERFCEKTEREKKNTNKKKSAGPESSFEKGGRRKGGPAYGKKGKGFVGLGVWWGLSGKKGEKCILLRRRKKGNPSLGLVKGCRQKPTEQKRNWPVEFGTGEE